MQAGSIGMRRQAGFTMVEMLVALVVGSFLITALFRIWNNNRRTTDLIANKGDFRDRATLATTQLNRSITMAGFGITDMDVILRRSGSQSDTLIVFTNPGEYRTTLIDSAASGQREIRVFKDSGIAVGGFLGITDSIRREYARVESIEGNLTDGFHIHLSGGLANSYSAGVPHIYPVQRERYFVDVANRTLVRFVDDRRLTVGSGITQFQVQLLNGSGNPAATHRDIRVVTFSLTGSYKAPAGMPSLMSFSSTVIPRNIL